MFRGWLGGRAVGGAKGGGEGRWTATIFSPRHDQRLAVAREALKMGNREYLQVQPLWQGSVLCVRRSLQRTAAGKKTMLHTHVESAYPLPNTAFTSS